MNILFIIILIVTSIIKFIEAILFYKNKAELEKSNILCTYILLVVLLLSTALKMIR